MGVPQVIDLALSMPRVFLQMAHDARLTASKRDAGRGARGWRRAGETAAQARDRLRAGREEAKRRMGVG